MTSAAASATYSAGRAGYGPHMPGSFALPTPNAYRSPFRKPDGSYDWEGELAYGFAMIDAQSAGSLAAVLVEVEHGHPALVLGLRLPVTR